MGSISVYAKNALIDHVFKAPYSPSATLYLALLTEEFVEDSLVETDYAGYVRASLSGASIFSAASLRKVVQGTDLSFAKATGAGSLNISHWAITDAATDGNVLAYGAFNVPWAIVSGNTPRIPSGEMEISMSASPGAGFTDFTAHKLLDLMFRNQAWTTPSTSLYAGAATATLADTSTSATEPSGNGYAREAVPAASFTAASAGANVSQEDITIGEPTGSWGTVVSLFIADAETAGNILGYDNDNVVDQGVNQGDTVVVSSGSFSYTM